MAQEKVNFRAFLCLSLLHRQVCVTLTQDLEKTFLMPGWPSSLLFCSKSISYVRSWLIPIFLIEFLMPQIIISPQANGWMNAFEALG